MNHAAAHAMCRPQQSLQTLMQLNIARYGPVTL